MELVDAIKHIKTGITSGSIVSYEAAGQIDSVPAEITMVGAIEEVAGSGKRSRGDQADDTRLGIRVINLQATASEHGKELEVDNSDIKTLQAGLNSLRGLVLTLSDRQDEYEKKVDSLDLKVSQVLSYLTPITDKLLSKQLCGKPNQPTPSEMTVLEGLSVLLDYVASEQIYDGGVTVMNGLASLMRRYSKAHEASGQVMISDSHYILVGDDGLTMEGIINYSSYAPGEPSVHGE